jgi:hypothetical protein
MTNILGISGAKQSGKTTCSRFLHGYQLRLHEVVNKFFMDDDGNLLVNAVQIDENGEEIEGLGILDIERRDEEFLDYCSRTVWPYVRSFSFADPLKVIAVSLFGLSENQCFGTDEDKNTPVNIKWEDMPEITGDRSGFMTAREFLQYFGTDVCRRIKEDVWTSACIDRILSSGTELAIVPDVRFPNEVEAIQKAGGKVVRLDRKPYEDGHSSEIALETYSGFDYYIKNHDMNMDETNVKLMEVLKEWGWLKTKSS